MTRPMMQSRIAAPAPMPKSTSVFISLTASASLVDVPKIPDISTIAANSANSAAPSAAPPNAAA